MDILDQLTENEYAHISAAHDHLIAATLDANSIGPDEGVVLMLRAAEDGFARACEAADVDPAEVLSAL